MAKETVKTMPADLLPKWEEVHGCYKLLATGRAKIEHKTINGEMVYYTKPAGKKETWGEMLEKKRQVIIGDYKVQQATNRHVAIVYIPEQRLVFHAQTSEWLSEEKMREMLDFYFKMSGKEKE